MADPSQPVPRIGVLATDLDGTLIPIAESGQQQTDLQRLAQMVRDDPIELVFVTGRHLDSVIAAIDRFDLPLPRWIICDVGTSIFRRGEQGQWGLVTEYADRLSQVLGLASVGELAPQLKRLEENGLRLQESEKQGRFKLSYYCVSSQLDRHHEAIESHCQNLGLAVGLIGSVDPFNGDGLIDILPSGVSKAFALDWWVDFSGNQREAVVFAGDSGNDFAAMTAGYKTIVVGNADRKLTADVAAYHRNQGWENRLHLANASATSGVLEGWQHFKKGTQLNEIRL